MWNKCQSKYKKNHNKITKIKQLIKTLKTKQLEGAHEIAYLRQVNFYRRSLFQQENRAVARKSLDAAAVRFGLKFADNIHYTFKSSQTSKAMLQWSEHSGTTEFNAKWPFKVIQGHVKAIRD